MVAGAEAQLQHGSRICVKNLPKYVTEDRLREFFSQKGEITDAKLMRTKDGKSRQFAFIGFRTEEEAKEAIKYFHNSYLDTSRITCEVARKIGDPDIPRPWSQHSANKKGSNAGDNGKNSSSKSSEGKHEKIKSAKHSEENRDQDPQLQEFLEVMQPRSKSKLWANDTIISDEHHTSNRKEIHPSKGKSKETNKMEDEVGAEIIDGEKLPNEGSLSRSLPRESNDVAGNPAVSDMDYFKSRVRKDWSDSEADERESSDKCPSDNEDTGIDSELYEGENLSSKAGELHEKTGEDNLPEVPDGEVFEDGDNPSSSLISDEQAQVLETGRLFVRNLPYTATEDELAELFKKYGDISQVHLVVDKDTRRSKGFGYVLYTLPESAVRALKELDKSIFQGRLLHVLPAKQQNAPEKPQHDLPMIQGSNKFKQKREEQRKASEGSGDTRAWNALFMHSDTVAENIARKYGVSKSELLNPEADDLAVRLALGETQVIAETKKAFTSAGVNITVLEELASGRVENVKRSNHVLLVKNLPYGSSEADLTKMFSKFGSLDKIILPPTKAMALVSYLEAAEARAAFKGLAYKRYKDLPLYLEWAPDNIFRSISSLDTKPQHDAIAGTKDATTVVLEQSAIESDEDVDPDRVESRSVFVKNLNFKTTEESLRRHFLENLKGGSIRSIKVKKHVKNGKNLSMGFGFIEFDSVETARNTCKQLQGTVLEGHALILQLCHSKKNASDEIVRNKVEKEKSSTKLIVRNVAFEATKKDLKQLFSAFGQIKSLRLPKKFDGNHRGFAFVEFVTKQEAQNAFDALSSSHLYGRHLVLERAKEGETLEELRARTASHFVDEQSGFQNPSKLSKKRKRFSVVDEGSVKFERITG
ncbi:LOW QUALITY PROTEIN: multiple RNA-binding domain-containing protein 1 [Amborella trichopoda]|nr:LOW QUALITY PROTEIN: multiple RNA-binding domain-containing protein 1 [Amborella trichopoda]|eukprot:XP_006827686.3 LOW QUALITY PROTEIN: multiple RNA-binding domain-containing protein 1 [Amborella trichopoda]